MARQRCAVACSYGVLLGVKMHSGELVAELRLSAVGYCIPLCTGMEYRFSEKNPRSGVL